MRPSDRRWCCGCCAMVPFGMADLVAIDKWAAVRREGAIRRPDVAAVEQFRHLTRRSQRQGAPVRRETRGSEP
jgi:hypothetical protein